MLFYLADESDIKLIPSSYTVLVVSDTIKTIEHSNYARVDLLPDISSIEDKDKLKKKFKKKIKDKYKLKIAAIVNDLQKLPPANSIVFVMSQKDKELYKFNYVKTICSYIEDRYGYRPFKFTNCVTRDMRQESKMDNDGLNKLVVDMMEVKNALQSK